MYRLNEAKMFYDLADNQAIIIDSSTGLYYALNPLGSVAFDFLARGAARDAVLTALRAIPGAPDDTDAQLREFEERLLGYEILIPAEEAAPLAVAISPELAADGFILALDQFDDAQEIMLADPIHDIDLEEGWPFLKNPDATA